MPRDEPEWVTYDQAAKLIGCSRSTIDNLVSAGRIDRRRTSRCFPSLNRESVVVVGQEWRREQRTRRQRAARRAKEAGERMLPPDAETVWLAAAEVAALLNVSRVRINQLARAGKLPYVERGGRRWYRRQDMEIVAAVRAFRSRVSAGRT